MTTKRSGLWDGDLSRISGEELRAHPSLAGLLSDEAVAEREVKVIHYLAQPDGTGPQGPTVTIGKPEVWNLEPIMTQAPKPKEPAPFLQQGTLTPDMTQSLKAKFKRNDYYLVRFAGSVHPGLPGGPDYEWKMALLSVSFNSGTAGQPIAFSIDPVQVETAVTRSREVDIGPDLKFAGQEASVAGVKWTKSFPEPKARVMGMGIGEKEVTWRYQPVGKEDISGQKVGSVIVEAPKGMRPGTCSMNLYAAAQVYRGPLHLFGVPTSTKETSDYPLWS